MSVFDECVKIFLQREAEMPVKTFTFYNLGRDLDNLAPGFGLTVDYDLLEGLIRSIGSVTCCCGYIAGAQHRAARERH